MGSELFLKKLKEVPEDSRRFASKSLDILDQVGHLKKTEKITQKEIALKLNKKESEISKWLSGLHNLTLKSICKLESVFGMDILITPLKAEKRYKEVKFVSVKVIKYNLPASIERDEVPSGFETYRNLAIN